MELNNCTCPGSIYVWLPSRWIQICIFTDRFRHFIRHVKPTAEDPSSLFLTVTSLISVTSKSSIQARKNSMCFSYPYHVTALVKFGLWTWRSWGPWNATTLKKSNFGFIHVQANYLETHTCSSHC